MNNVLLIIQARLGSQRLPNKILLQIPPNSGVSMLEHVVRKSLLATMVDEVVVVTPDRMVAILCNRWNISAYMPTWTERDVLREFYEAAKDYFGMDDGIIVRITADCPMLVPEEISRCVERFIKEKPDILYNTDEQTGQLDGEGSDVEVFSYSALEKAYNNAVGEEREHITLWMRRNLKSVFCKGAPLGLRSVNTCEDYRWVCNKIKAEISCKI